MQSHAAPCAGLAAWIDGLIKTGCLQDKVAFSENTRYTIRKLSKLVCIEERKGNPMKNENVWKTYGEKELQELHAVNEKYKKCLDAGKTERECVTLAIKMAEEAGYRDVKEVLAAGKPLVCGDKVYANYMGKALALLRMGEKPISAGMNILGAHIDSPRIDIKQNPLYENEEFAYLDTHYYGGIKKYQWGAIGPATHWYFLMPRE